MSHDCAVMTGIFSKNGVSLERLQTLGKVVRAGSIALAAKGDPVAQSQISRQIGELERVLGLRLLDRTKKPFPPTREAVRLADACERFLREVEEVSEDCAGITKSVTVGAGELVIREVLIPWIGRRRKESAGISWVMRNLPSRKIGEELAAERLDVGLASGLEESGRLRVKTIATYGMKLVLPEKKAPDKSGWKRLSNIPVVVLEGDGGFRNFLAGCERDHGAYHRIGAECTSYSQAVDLAEAAGWAVFVPELWWRRRKEWLVRTQVLPGLGDYQHSLKLAWNRKVAERRPEVAALVRALGGRS